jgi:hypothetical protein
MQLDDFRTSLSAKTPTPLSLALQAMWWDAKGDWTKAHECAQAQDDGDGAWVHAYLHRKEGDLGNADYWYRRAGRQRPAGALGQEWEEIVSELLRRSSLAVG